MSATVGLTVKNVRMALRGVSWRKVGEMLFIPSSRLNVIAEECNSEEQCEAAVIRYWIIRDPFASWRRIVQRLDRVREHDVADNLRHYTEELNGNMSSVYDIIISGRCRIIQRGGGGGVLGIK